MEVTGVPPGDYVTDHGPITVTSVVYEESFSCPPYFWVKTSKETDNTTMHLFDIVVLRTYRSGQVYTNSSPWAVGLTEI